MRNRIGLIVVGVLGTISIALACVPPISDILADNGSSGDAPPVRERSGVYLVDADGVEWKVPVFGGGGGAVYVPERDWVVSFRVIGPDDSRYDGTHWQAYTVRRPVDRPFRIFESPDCTGTPLTIERTTAQQPEIPDPTQWQPAAPPQPIAPIIIRGPLLDYDPMIQSIQELDNAGGVVCTAANPDDFPPTSEFPPTLSFGYYELIDVTPDNWPPPPPEPYTIKFDRL